MPVDPYRPDEPFNGLLLRYRGRSGLTQRQLASLLGVHVRSVQEWEAGANYPSAERLQILIKVLLETGVLGAGAELNDAEALWAAVERDSPRMKMPFDHAWFSRLLAEHREPPSPGLRPASPRGRGWTSPLPLGEAASAASGEAERRQDWAEAPDVLGFVGRSHELTTLRSWIVEERCRLVALVGMGGIGKTSIAAKLAEEVAPTFQRLYWRSLRDAPPTGDWLAGAVGFLSDQEVVTPRTESEQLAALLQLLRDRRCLLVLDNFDTLFESGQTLGRYRPGVTGYGSLIERVGEASHQSCLLLTSREAPAELAILGHAVRTFHVDGLRADEARELLASKHLHGTNEQWAELIARFGGNGLALKIVGERIRELFDGDIGVFLDMAEGGSSVFGGIRRLLSEQVDRSSPVEEYVLNTLAVEREPATLSALLADLAGRAARGEAIEALEALRRRSLVEAVEAPGIAAFTLQSVVLEYVTDRIVHAVVDELERGQPRLVEGQPLIRARAKEYVRQSQERLLGETTLQLLKAHHSQEETEQRLLTLLRDWQRQPFADQRYGPGNAINLLRLLRGDLRRLDLSGLAIRQAYLAGVEAQDASLAGSQLADSVLAEAFDFPASLALSADGTFLAAGTSTGQLWLWRVADRTLVGMYEGHGSAIWGLALAADGSLLASGGGDGTIRLWEPMTGSPLASWQAHSGAAWSLALAADTRMLVSGGDDGTLGLWEVPTGRSLATLHGHAGAVRSVALGADGEVIASGGQDGVVRLWNARSGQLLFALHGHTEGLWGVALTADGRLVASGGQDGTVRLWDTASGDPMATLEGLSGGVWSVALSGDGHLLAGGDGDGRVRLWSSEAVLRGGENAPPTATLQGHAGAVWGARLSRDGRLVATSGGDGTVRLWETSTGHPLVTLQGQTSAVRGVALTADGALVVSGGQDGIVRLWDANSGQLRASLVGHTGGLWDVALSGDGRLIASSSGDGTVRLWSFDRLTTGGQTGRPLATLSGHTGGVWCVGLSADGQLVASGGQDGTVRIWQSSTGRSLSTVRGHRSAVTGLAISQDGKFVATGGGGGLIRVCEAPTGKLLLRLEGHTSAVWGMALWADAQLLASGSEDGTVRLWDLRSGQSLAVLQAHTSGVYGVALAAKGQLLASAGADGEVKLWDVTSRQPLATLHGHNGVVRGVALSADGRLVASCGFDETVRLWDSQDASSRHVLRSARRYEGVNITGLTGITEAQRQALIALGAVERIAVTA